MLKLKCNVKTNMFFYLMKKYLPRKFSAFHTICHQKGSEVLETKTNQICRIKKLKYAN